MDETNGTTPHEDPRDDETTERPAADEDATRVLRGDEAGTRIWSGDDAEATRVMPAGAAGAGASPPPPPVAPPQPQPTLIMSRPTHRSPGSVWWIVLLLILAVLAAAAVWYFWLRGGQEATPTPSPSPTPVAWAGAWARAGDLGGGLIIEGGGETYQATAYDGALQPSDTVTAVPAADGAELRFTLPAQFSFGGPAGPLEATLTIGSDPDTASLRLTGADGTTLAMPLQRVPSLTRAAPTTSPSPTSTPTPTPTPTPSPSPSPSQEALRQQMIAAIDGVQAGIEAWATANGGTYPMPADVRQGGAVAQYVDPWPVDPWAPAQFLAPGAEPGGYSYEQLEGGLSYTLKGYLDNGSYVVP